MKRFTPARKLEILCLLPPVFDYIKASCPAVEAHESINKILSHNELSQAEMDEWASRFARFGMVGLRSNAVEIRKGA
jgi:hypothetical protein